MKTKFLLVLFFSGSFYAGAQNPHMRSIKFDEHFALPQQNKPILTKQLNSLIQLYDSIYTWLWDSTTQTWNINPYQRIINIVYDANNNLVNETHQAWYNNVWNNLAFYTNIYNAGNYRTSQVKQTWNSNAWRNDWRYTYTYDANNNQTSILEQTWGGSAWSNYYLYTYTYDANNNQTSKLKQTWNGGPWTNSSLTSFTYDANNNMTSQLWQGWINNAWYDGNHHTYTYDANNNLTSEFAQSWNGNVWLNGFLRTYTYDANNNCTGYTLHVWNGSAWENQNLYTYTYDANNNLTYTLLEFWNGSAWQTIYQFYYTYDADNFLKSYAAKHSNSTLTSIMSGDSAHYYFHTAVGINNLQASDDGEVIISPNPTSGSFTLQSTNQQINNSIITITNALGEKIYSSLITHHPSLITLNAPSGIYFVELHSSEKTLTRKIILSK